MGEVRSVENAHPRYIYNGIIGSGVRWGQTSIESLAYIEDCYGSITLSQKDDGSYAWGVSWDFDNLNAADAEAINQCRRPGGSYCAGITWLRNACGALAVGDRNGYGAGEGEAISLAEYQAMSSCNEANYGCRIIDSRYSGL